MNDSHLHTAVSQCIDEVCFEATHAIDDDLRWIKADSQNTVRQLKVEQERRLDAQYAAAPASPEYLAAQLEELYAADAASINEDNGEGQQVIEQMSDVTVKIFKKEMKQRIHEWEGGFRRRYGREATPHDKAAIRNIYELYKAVKSRALRSADSTAPTTNAPQQHQPNVSGGANRPAATNAVANPPFQQQSQTSGSSFNPPQFNSNLRSSQQQQQQPQQQPTNIVQVGNPQQSRPVTANQQPRNSGGVSAMQSGAGPTQSSIPVSSSNNNNGNANNNNQYLFPGLDLRDIPAVTSAKRQLKRLLHAFEDDFKERNGRVPTREERRPMQREYLRYGELKAVLSTVTDD